MSTGLTDLCPSRTCRAALHLTVALSLAASAFSPARAQTQFSHDPAGNRTGQEAAAATTSPQITVPPTSQLGRLAGTAHFSVAAAGPGPFTYEWLKDGVAIPGASSDVLELAGLTGPAFTPYPGGTPQYSVRITNAHGSVVSQTVALYLDSLGAGLPDWWRQQHFGSTAAVNPYADADADGVTNGQEYADGTAPMNAGSRRAKVTLVGPLGLMSKSAEAETYAGGASVTIRAGHSGELQFGGFTGTRRSQERLLNLVIPGDTTTTGDVVLKGLYGSMPVQKTAAATPAFTYDSGSGASLTGFATTPQGAWLGYGFFNRVNDQPFVGVARFAADGTLDASFNPSPNGVINGAAILPDGKVMLGGLFSELSGQQRSGIARLLANGTVDPSFTVEAGGENLVAAMEMQRDGKVLLGGSLWDGATVRPLLRRNTKGSVDTSFTVTTDGTPMVLRQQPDGKILVGGDFTQVNGTPTPKLVRLNLDGTLDGSFNLAAAAGAVTSSPARVLVQANGKILVAGAVQVRLNGNTVTLPLVRLNADGTLDAAFTQKVQAVAASVTFADITLQTDGRIVGVGTFTLANPAVVNAVRFRADGSVDADCFVISRPDGPLKAVAAQADGSLLMGGQFSSVSAGASTGNNHSYFITPARMGWNAAEALGVKLGGHLASVSGVNENSFLGNTLLPAALGTAPAWLGFTDAGVESLFAWTSGEPANFTSWQSGEPNNYNNEDHSAMNYFPGWQGNWVDTPDGGVSNPGQANDGPYYGIIEVDPGSTPATTQNWVAGRDMLANERAGLAAKSTNPNPTVPAWSYGRRATLASTGLTLFSSAEQRHADGAIEGWEAPNHCGVLVNITDAPGFYLGPRPLHPGEMYLHPGSDLEYTVVRWTAPAAGTYVVTGFWQDFSWGMGDGGSANIVVNGTVAYTQDFDNTNGAFQARVLVLNAGDIVDFALGARGGYEADGTRFNAVVTKVEDGLSDLWWAGHDLATNEKPDGLAKETTNPNPTAPAWSYGRRSTYHSSGMDLFTGAGQHITGGGVDGPMEGWANGATVLANTNGNDAPPHVYDFGFGPNVPFNSREMLVAPAGTGGPYPVVRWTAPEAGRYEVFSYWQDSDPHGGNGVDGFILVNGSQVYAMNMDNGAGCSTVQSLDVKAGDVVDFVLGDRGDFAFDVTKFNAVIVRPASATIPSVPSGTVSLAASRSEISSLEKINWAAAAANNGDIAGNPFVIESSAGVRYQVRKTTMGAFRRLTQSSSWFGNFSPGDALLTHPNSDGPVIIEAASRGGVFSAIGMQIQPNVDTAGPFTATIRAYDVNGALLGTFTANGNASSSGDNSALFVGVKSTVENIHSISVDTNSTTWGGDFAINQVSIQASNPGSLVTLRANFARLVTSNTVRPLSFSTTALGQTTFPANGSTSMLLSSEAAQEPVSFAVLESSLDGQTYQPLSYGASANGQDWSFPVSALPPGANYFRAMLRTTNREEVRTHAVGPLITPPVVTSALVAEGEVGTPFSYTGTATGQLTDFAAISLPAWATAIFDANSGRVTISGTPTAGGTRNIMLQPANAAGSTSSLLALTIVSSLDSWQNLHFTAAELADESISGPLGDATGAGIPNLMKYALGIPPKQPGTAGMPAGMVAQEGASKYLTFVYNRDTSANVTMTVEVSGDLVTWNSGPAYTTEVSRVPQGGTMETVTVRDNVPSSSGQKRFMRLKVTQ